VPRVAIAQQQPPSPDDHLLHGRQQIDRVRLDTRLVLGLPDAHLSTPGQQHVHQALEVRREVLQDDEGHACISWQVREEPLERVEAASGRADADDVEVLALVGAGGGCGLYR